MPHAVCVVARSVQSAEFSHSPTARLSNTGINTTAVILVGDHSKTNSSEYAPSRTLYEELLNPSWIHVAHLRFMADERLHLLYASKSSFEADCVMANGLMAWLVDLYISLSESNKGVLHRATRGNHGDRRLYCIRSTK